MNSMLLWLGHISQNTSSSCSDPILTPLPALAPFRKAKLTKPFVPGATPTRLNQDSILQKLGICQPAHNKIHSSEETSPRSPALSQYSIHSAHLTNLYRQLYCLLPNPSKIQLRHGRFSHYSHSCTGLGDSF